jgi:hypothetical protein
MGSICVRNQMKKISQSTDKKALSLIQSHGRGWVFTPANFQGLGTRNAIASALKRFKASGVVRQLTRGLYDYPVEDPVLGPVAPSAERIARALVVRDSIRLQPSGDYAANILGLSEQVPSRIVFLTDGPARKVKIGKREIHLQHTTPRNMATAGRKSGTIIQALRHIGKDRIDDRTIAILRRRIDDKDRASLRKDLVHAPAWIADLLRPLTEGTTTA